jgi:hypothetical protein
MKSTFKVIAATSLVAVLTACSSTNVSSKDATFSKEQQLANLKQSYDAGAMSRQEYDAQRQKLMDKETTQSLIWVDNSRDGYQ